MKMNDNLFTFFIIVWLVCSSISGVIPTAEPVKDNPMPTNGVDIVVPY